MRNPSRRPRRLVGVLLAGALVASACGGDDSGGDDDTTTDPSAVDTSAPAGSAPDTGGSAPGSSAPDGSTPAGSAPDGSAPESSAPDGGDALGGSGELSAPAEEVDPDGVLRFGYTIGPSQGLDPHKTSLAQDTVWLAPIYDPLIIEMPDASLQPGLATEWEFVDDGAALRLTLREGVTFQDGEPFDAEAVKANLERAKTVEGSAVAPLLAVVDAIEVIDPVTVELALNGPAATLPRILSDRPGMMISPAAMDDPSLPENPVGAGMYRVEEYRVGDRAVMVPFEEYWNPEWVQLSRLEMIQIGDSGTRLNGVRSGQLDLALLDAPQFQEAEGDSNLTTEQFETTTNIYLQPNRTRAEFDNVLVRQAMNHAIDREGIAETVFLGYADGSPQFYTEAFPDGFVADMEERYPYDPDEARRLLAEAGLEDGFSFDLLVPTLPTNEAIGQIVQAQFAEVGITANILPVDPTAAAATFYNDKRGDMIVGTTPGRTDPAMLTQLFYTAEANSNPDGHTIPEVTEAYEAALEPLPDEERVPLLHELMTQTVEQAGNVVLAHPRTLLAGVDAVAGFHWSLRGQPDFRGTAMATG